MHATLAFLNGAGSQRRSKSAAADRRLLTLTNLLSATGFIGETVEVQPAIDGRSMRARRPIHGTQRFPR
jgi:hypothetical protein